MAFDPIGNFFNTITNTFKSFLDFVSSIAASIANFLINLPVLVQQALQWLLDQMVNFVKYVWNSVVWVFNQVYSMILNAVASIVNNVQCGLAEIYRRVRERIPVLLAYNAALAYARRVISRGRPRDFLKIVPMSLMAGLGGVALASLLPDIPADRCLQVVPFPVSAISQALQPLELARVERVQAFFSTIRIVDGFSQKVGASGQLSDSLDVVDSFKPTRYVSKAFSDSLDIVDSFGTSSRVSKAFSDQVSVGDSLDIEVIYSGGPI